MSDHHTDNRDDEPETVGLEYGGKWIAWDEEGMRIVASGESLVQAKNFAQAAGVDDPILEKVPPSTGYFIGVA